MKLIRTMLAVLLFAATPTLSSAQETKIPIRSEIVVINDDDGDTQIEVFELINNGVRQYYLSVGHLGIGNEIIQFNFDPLFELFIPLGSTLDETIASLEELQALYKQDNGTSIEIKGCLDPLFPTENLETVNVTRQTVLLSRLLRFDVQREGYLRATHVSRSDFNSLVRGVKLHKKLHPKD